MPPFSFLMDDGHARLTDASGRLLGEAVVAQCAMLSEVGVLPPASRCGVVRAGDFFVRRHLDRRGGTGDVRQVWAAFSDRFRWVVGVSGNHDTFGKRPSAPAFEQFFAEPGRYFLDANTIEVDGLCLAGLSGVVGRNSGKPWRRPEALLAREARRLADGMPDLLVMHDGPCGSEDQPGWPAVTAELERAAPTLVVRGHEHWDRPLATLANGTQVLNVDSRVVVLRT